MGCSAILKAMRALVVLVRALAMTYTVAVNCNRVSTNREAAESFRKVALKAHPGRVGNIVDMGWLGDARAAWHTCAEVV